MGVYFITVSIVLIFTYVAQHSLEYHDFPDGYELRRSRLTNFCLLVTTVTLISIAGFRYHVGSDYKSYAELYYQYIKTPVRDLFTLNEPVFPVVGFLCGKVASTSALFFLIMSIFTVGTILVSTYLESPDFLFVTLMFIFTGCWHGTFNGMRQYLAIAIIYAGRDYIFDRKFLNYCIVCFGAFLCHKSALVAIALYFIYSDEIKVSRIVEVVFGSVLILFSYGTVFRVIGWMNQEEFLVTDYATASVSFFRVAVGVVPGILATYYAFKKDLDEEQRFYFYLLLANAAVKLATGQSAYLARFAMYTGIFVPLGLNSITKATDEKYYTFFRRLIIFLYFVYWLYDVFNSSTLSHYEFIFGRYA